MVEVGNYLRAALRKRGITQKALASAMGMTKEHISTICLNKRRPSFETLERICEQLDLTLAEFFADPDEPSIPLTTDELLMINEYRDLQQHEKDGVFCLMHTLNARRSKEKGPSPGAES